MGGPTSISDEWHVHALARRAAHAPCANEAAASVGAVAGGAPATHVALAHRLDRPCAGVPASGRTGRSVRSDDGRQRCAPAGTTGRLATMRMGRLLCGALICGALSVGGFAGGALADPTGVWLTEPGEAHVKIYRCGDDVVCGDIIWLKNPLGRDGKPLRDVLNKDESLRGREVIGIQVLFDLEDDGGGEWEDGEIYNAKDGKTYDAELEEVGKNTLEVSGCVLFLCKTETWTRVE